MIDHVAHPGQDHQARRFRVTRNRQLQRLAFDLEKADRLARRVYARSRTDARVIRRPSIANPLAVL